MNFQTIFFLSETHNKISSFGTRFKTHQTKNLLDRLSTQSWLTRWRSWWKSWRFGWCSSSSHSRASYRSCRSCWWRRMSLKTQKRRSAISQVSQPGMFSQSATENSVVYVLSVTEKHLEAIIPVEQAIAWKWSIIIAFTAPEIGTVFRSLRLCFFKSIRSFTWREFVIVLMFESLHVIGMCLFAFTILPELDVIQGAMLTNCLCFVPSIICRTISPWFICLQHVINIR